MHWENPLLLANTECDALWSRNQAAQRLVVVGSGFDIRATVAVERMVRVAKGPVDGLMIMLPEDSTDPGARPFAQSNQERIEEIVTSSGGTLHVQALPDYNDSRSLGRLVSRNFQESGLLDAYSDVTLEVSAMPRSVYFPLIRGILERAHRPASDDLHWTGDFHVAVCESPRADASILEEGTTPMSPIGGFGSSGVDTAVTKIWVPVLGERSGARVSRLYEELEPNETCPVVPWPSTDPRRGDRLILEYRQLLFEDIRLEARNIIHAAERNPFDLYRTIGVLWRRYVEALGLLGQVSMVLSSHSSKLLSVGVLLAAYEYDLDVQHVSPGSYGLLDGHEELGEVYDLYNVWLVGEPYHE